VYGQLNRGKSFLDSCSSPLGYRELLSGGIAGEFAPWLEDPTCLWKCIPSQSDPSSDVDFYYQRSALAKHAQSDFREGHGNSPAPQIRMAARLDDS